MPTIFFSLLLIIWTFYPSLFHKYLKNSMWSTWVFIHCCLIYWSAFSSNFNKLIQLLLSFDIHLCKAINKYTCFRIFSQFQIHTLYVLIPKWCRGTTLPDWALWLMPGMASAIPTVTASLQQKIRDLFHIYFQKRDCDSELGLIWVQLNVVEEIAYASGYYSAFIV